jgi:hypothetical protein
MLSLLLFAALATDRGDLAAPLDLYEMSVEQAQKLHGCRIEVFLELGCPVDVGGGFTVAGAYERSDGVERSVYLKGEHHDLAAGDKLSASGTLLVIRHKGAIVNGIKVPGWTEIRIEQCRVWTGPR